MNLESLSPFLLLIAPFAFAFLIEAATIFLFRLKSLGLAMGISVLVNLLTLAVLYGFGLLLGRLGYNLSGLQVPLPAVAFLWWLSMIIDALLLQLFLKGKDRKQVFLCSIIMNTVSYLFLYVVVSYDH
jgi:hypothetical protein